MGECECRGLQTPTRDCKLPCVSAPAARFLQPPGRDGSRRFDFRPSRCVNLLLMCCDLLCAE